MPTSQWVGPNIREIVCGSLPMPEPFDREQPNSARQHIGKGCVSWGQPVRYHKDQDTMYPQFCGPPTCVHML